MNKGTDLEENLFEKKIIKQQNDKQLLNAEIIISFTSSLLFISLLFISIYIDMHDSLKMFFIIFGFVTFIIGVAVSLLIEQKAGYYECRHCHNKYVPTFMSVFLAMHINRTRLMKCPKCKKWSWQKKVVS